MSTPTEFLKNKKIDKDKINLNDLKFKEKVLWHGIKIEHAALALDKKFLPARTTHRYWENGKTLRDDHPDYEKSGWMFGWSTTRERNYAGTWGDVVMVLDREKIKEEFKIRPLSWTYKLSQGSEYFKREREDFILSCKDPRTMDEVMKDYHKIIDKEDYDAKYEDMYEYWRDHKGKVLNIEKVLKGFLISDFALDIFGAEDKDVKKIMSHDKFLGVYNRDNAGKQIELQPNPKKNRLFKL